MSSSNVLENGQIAQGQVEEIVGMALESLKTLMVDYETPIEIRLQVALKIFETFGQENKGEYEDHITHGLAKNARDIQKNAHQLSNIETLLKIVAQTKHEARLQNEPYSDEKVIMH